MDTSSSKKVPLFEDKGAIIKQPYVHVSEGLEGTDTNDILRIISPSALSSLNLLLFALDPPPTPSRLSLPPLPVSLLHNSCCGRELVSGGDELTAAHPAHPASAALSRY